MTKPSPFKWFKTSPEIIRLAVMMYVRFPLSLRNVEGCWQTNSNQSQLGQ
jgi:putative transposase